MARQSVADMNDRAPLRETRAHIAVFRQAITKPVEAFGNCFAWRAGEGLRACVDLNARQNTLCRQNLSERRDIGARLADRLVLHDDAADELSHARSKKHFAVATPALLGRLDAKRIEAPR
jgi:hypothetical protein